MTTQRAVAAVSIGFALLSCSSDATTSKATTTPEAVLGTYADNLAKAYGDALDDEKTFAANVETFLAAPDEAKLTSLRTAWLASRAHYMLTEGARFYDGPIDIDPPNHEASLNSWPLDEAYLDYTTNAGVPDETTGLVNHPDLMPTISIEALDAVNAKDGDNNISNGYHAIEFLLWGQALVPVGPGTRPATDFVVGGPRKNADRRQAYLRVVTQAVVSHLDAVRVQWLPGATYRESFVHGGLPSIGLVLTGLGKMSKGELASQRINAPYASKSRRDQHDCFSSETLVDYERDARGIQNLYLGRYEETDGPGVDELVRAVDPDLDARLQKQIQATIDAIASIPKPFESAIVGDDASPGRSAVRASVSSLRAQADMFADAATALGLTIQVPEEN